MIKYYLLVYNDSIGSREHVKRVLDSDNRIINWRYDLPNMFYLKSSASADELAKIIDPLTGSNGMFIVAEIKTNNKQGWLPEDTWSFLSDYR